jgi:hypothetical protein
MAAAGQLGPRGSDGFARMVIPGDKAGRRYVSDLVDLQVRALPVPGPMDPGGISNQLLISGEVADPTNRYPRNTIRQEPLGHRLVIAGVQFSQRREPLPQRGGGVQFPLSREAGEGLGGAFGPTSPGCISR